MSNSLLYAVANHVALITLNRPERMNAWTREMGTAYFDALDRANADPQVRVIVVTGAGRGFCPGADMDLLQNLSTGSQQLAQETRDAAHPTKINKPVIAAINGACAGLGMAVALACDLRFAAAGAKFTTAFSRRGLIAEHGLSWTLPRLVGQSVAMDLLLSARVFEAAEAKELGVVNQVFSADELMAKTMAYAHELSSKVCPTSMAIIKRQVLRHGGLPLKEAMAESMTLMQASLKRPDFKEGVASYLEKRDPHFGPVISELGI